jgi:hypothetical protein
VLEIVMEVRILEVVVQEVLVMKVMVLAGGDIAGGSGAKGGIAGSSDAGGSVTMWLSQRGNAPTGPELQQFSWPRKAMLLSAQGCNSQVAVWILPRKRSLA